MYMNGTHRNTCRIHARYMQDTWDTYRIGKNTKTYRKPHVTPTPPVRRCPHPPKNKEEVLAQVASMATRSRRTERQRMHHAKSLRLRQRKTCETRKFAAQTRDVDGLLGGDGGAL